MKTKIIFGVLWSAVGIALFGWVRKYDSAIDFPLTNWLGNTALLGYVWFLMTGVVSVVVGKKHSAVAGGAAASAFLLLYCIFLIYEMAFLKHDHTLFPIEIVLIMIMFIPLPIVGLLCDGIMKYRSPKKN